MSISANETVVHDATTVAKARSLFRPDIEGLRAIAIFLVVGYHTGIPGLSGGYIGVDVFFVVSGYLITGLLVREVKQTGTINFASFYARRARRLLPALSLVLLVTVIVSAVIYPPFEASEGGFGATAASTAAYSSNLYFAARTVDYFGPNREENPFLHTWSLSVEEQFYLIWPLFVLLGLGAFSWQARPGNGDRRLLWWMVTAAGLSFALSLYLTRVLRPWAYFMSAARAWEFAVGAVALLLPQKSKARPWTGWVGVTGVFAAVLSFDTTTPFPGFAALLPVLSTAIILRAAAENPDSRIVKGLSVQPLQEVGRLSYSWYLWHWPVFVLGAAIFAEPSFPLRAAFATFSLGLSIVSYRLVENPIRNSPKLTKQYVHSLAMAVVLAILGIGVSLVWRQASLLASARRPQVRYARARSDGPLLTPHCFADYSDVQIQDCIYGARDSTTSIVLLGDSHAAQWFSALEPIASKRHWQLVIMVKSACAMVDAEFFYPPLGRVYTECARWRKNALEKIDEIRPILTVVSSEEGYLFQDAQWRNGVSTVINALAASSQNVMVLKDTPRAEFDVPTCLARQVWRPAFIAPSSCDFPLIGTFEAYDLQRLAGYAHQNIAFADMSSSICSGDVCSAERAGSVLYRDSNHLTASFIETLQRALSQEIDQALTRERSKAGAATLN